MVSERFEDDEPTPYEFIGLLKMMIGIPMQIWNDLELKAFFAGFYMFL